MFELKHIKTEAAQHNYVVFGNGPVDLVMEIGLGATIGEWYHIAEHLAGQYTVLLYERSRSTKAARTPENIAKELHLLLDSLGHAGKIVLVAHSQGGLYAQQFARLYPDMVGGILFLDPLSARDIAYKTVFTPSLDSDKKQRPLYPSVRTGGYRRKPSLHPCRKRQKSARRIDRSRDQMK